MAKRNHRLKSVRAIDPVKRWSDAQRRLGDRRVVRRLTQDWYALYGTVGVKVSLEPYFARLAKLPWSQLPDSKTVEAIGLCLGTFPWVSVWEQFLQLLRNSPRKLNEDDWEPVQQRLLDSVYARYDAAVDFEDVEGVLRHLNRVLSVRRVLSLRSEHMSDHTAYTDGRSIVLPQSICLTPHQELNQWTYIRLLVHEIEHIESGSFDFRFRSPAGMILWNRLAPRRQQFRRSLWLSNSTKEIKDQIREMSSLRAFSLHFPEPQAVHQLINLAEDVRIERALAQKYPALAEIAATLDTYQQTERVHPRFMAPQDRFYEAMFRRAFGRENGVTVPVEWRPAWNRVAPILDNHRRRADTTIADSLTVTLDIIDALQEFAPGEQLQLLLKLLKECRPSNYGEVGERLQSRETTHDLEQPPQNPDSWVSYPDVPDRQTPPGPNIYYYSEQVATPELKPYPVAPVAVRELPWKPGPAHSSILQHPLPPPLHLGTQARRGGRDERYLEWGTSLHLGKAYDWQVNLRSRFAVDDRIFTHSRAVPQGNAVVSLCVDLTTSMEIARTQDESSPMKQSVHAVNWLTRWLEKSRVPVAIWGGIDGGRQPVTLYRVKRFQDLSQPDVTCGLHAIATGGFRLGTVVRHVASRAAAEYQSARSVCVLFTDATNHYVGPGWDDELEVFHRNRCQHCAMLKDCSRDPLTLQLNLRGTPSTNSVYLPTYVEMADLKAAIQEHPQTRVLLVLMTHGYRDTTLDGALGPGNWIRMTSCLDLDEIAVKIRNWILQ